MSINIFNSVKLSAPKRNVFDLTHDVKMSGKMGQLMPNLVLECIPGDKITLGSDVFMRFAPMYAPILHRVDATVHFFFVPNRLVWSNWENFITNQETGGMPTFLIDGNEQPNQIRLMDYMGVPPCNPQNGTPSLINAIPFAAYQCIYNEYYRDENLVNEQPYALTDGVQAIQSFLDLHNRAWEHDYFTAALPFAQKGDAVDIPLGTVQLKDDWNADGEQPFFADQFGGVPSPNIDPISNKVLNGDPAIVTSANLFNPNAYDPQGTLEVGATTINELRRAFRLQEWLERNARGGTRYIENILAHFNVRSSDKRLQRPEFICGVKTPVTITEVVNTSGAGDNPQGTMAGHGLSVGMGQSKTYSVEEHGYIIGIMSVMPKPAYQQGIPKTFLKRDPLDYFWPSFAHIGEQEIKVQELYAWTDDKDETFGYIPRYAEYKYMQSRVAGDFRTTLNFWHLGRIFGNQPALNGSFIECTQEEVERIFAVVGEDNLYIECLNKVKAVRPMPVYGTPYL